MIRGGASPIKPPQHPRQDLGQILRYESRTQSAGAGAVDPDGGAGGLEEGHALRQQATRKARQHIPRPRCGQPWGRVEGDGRTAIRGGDDRVRSLQDQGGAALPGRRPGALQLAVK